MKPKSKKSNLIRTILPLCFVFLLLYLQTTPDIIYERRSFFRGLPSRSVTESVPDAGLAEINGPVQLDNNSPNISVTNLEAPETQPSVQWVYPRYSDDNWDNYGWRQTKALADSEGGIWMGHAKTIDGRLSWQKGQIQHAFLTRFNPDGSLDWHFETKAPIKNIIPVIALNDYVICICQNYEEDFELTDNVKEYFECYNLKGNSLWTSEIVQQKIEPKHIRSFDAKVKRISKECFVLETGSDEPLKYYIFSLKDGSLKTSFEYSPVLKNAPIFLDEKTFIDVAGDKETLKGYITSYNMDLSTNWSNTDFIPDLKTSPQITSDGKLIFSSESKRFGDRNVCAIDQESGSLLWDIQLEYQDLLFTTASSKIICSNFNYGEPINIPDVSVYDSDGQLLNSFNMEDDIITIEYHSAIVYNDDKILCGLVNQGQNIIALFNFDGDILWMLRGSDLPISKDNWTGDVSLSLIGDKGILLEIGQDPYGSDVITLYF